jgi:hypothetical protein
MIEPRHSPHSQPRWKNIWIHGFVLGVGAVLIGLLVWFFIRGTDSAPPALTEEKAAEVQAPKGEAQPGKTPPVGPAAAPGVPAPSTPTLESELAQVLAGVREANQKKSLPQLLSHYSPNFPQLQQRVQHISKAWKIYDYPKMDFEISQIRLLADKTAEARVIWTVETRNISTLKNNTVSKTYLIRFAKESGQWRIKSLQNME